MTHRKAVLLVLALLAPAFSALAIEFGPVVIDVGEVVSTGATYGYAEIPLRIENTSNEDVTVTLSAGGRPEMYTTGNVITRLSRTFHAPAGAEMTVVLHQPAMALANDRMTVFINGRSQRNVLPLPASAHMGSNTGYLAGREEHHAVLTDLAIDALTRDTISATVATLSSSKASYFGNPYVAYPDHTDVWPETWLGFSRFLVVAVSESRWNTLAPQRKRALLDYITAGGVVVIVGSGTPPDIERQFSAAAPFTEAPPDGAAFRLGHGSVYAATDAFELDWWADVIQGAESSARWRLPTRRVSNDIDALPMTDHLALPVRSLLALLVVFAVLIGPVNVFVLTMLRRPVLLFVTTPLLGAFFAASVFAFGLLADGVRPSVRSTTLVVLDQQRQQAVSATLAAYYAPLTPGEGVAFSSNACVMPSMDTDGFRMRSRPTPVSLALSGTEQRFTSGLIRARLPAYVRLLTVETRRERVLIEHTPDGPVVLNGFASAIDTIWHADNSGTIYTGGPIAAGAQLTLTPLTGDRHPEVHGWSDVASTLAEAPRRGLVEYVLRDRDLSPRVVPRGGYVARLTAPAFFDPGLDNLKAHDATTLVVGTLAREGGAPRAR